MFALVLACYAALVSTAALAVLVWRERKLRRFRRGRLVDVAMVVREASGTVSVAVVGMSQSPEEVAARIRHALVGRTRPMDDPVVRVEPGRRY